MVEYFNPPEPKVGDILVDVNCVYDNLAVLSNTFIVGHPTDLPPQLIKKVVDDHKDAESFIKHYSDWKKDPGNNFTYFLSSGQHTPQVVQFQTEVGIRYGLIIHMQHEIICSVGKKKLSYISINYNKGTKSELCMRSLQAHKNNKRFISLDMIKKSYSADELFEEWSNWIRKNYHLIKKDPDSIFLQLYFES